MDYSLHSLVKRRIFVSYHHGGDQAYYGEFSAVFGGIYDVIYDHSLKRRLDSDHADYVMRRIREDYVTGSSCTVVLVGRETWKRKYVDWEIKATLDKEHGLIGIYLPTAPRMEENGIKTPYRLCDNVQSGFALWLSWEEIMASLGQFQHYVAEATLRRKALIRNTSTRLLRNL